MDCRIGLDYLPNVPVIDGMVFHHDSRTLTAQIHVERGPIHKNGQYARLVCYLARVLCLFSVAMCIVRRTCQYMFTTTGSPTLSTMLPTSICDNTDVRSVSGESDSFRK